MASRVDLPALQQSLDGFKAKVERWAKGAVRDSEALKEEHLRKIKECQVTLASLERTHEQLVHRAQEVQQRLAAEQAEESALQAELEAVRREQDALPPLLQELADSLDEQTAEYKAREAALSDTEALKERKLGALRTALAMYRSRLGLAFQHSDADGERLNVVFTNVDPRDPGRAFRLAVQVVGDSTYQACSCEPPVGGLADLLAALNASNNFSAFVRELRRRFRAVAQAEAAAAGAAS